MEETITEVEWERVRVSPFQPRRTFSDEDLEELAASIRAVGLIHPPVVREVMSGNQVLYYELIAGERRWRASKLAGLSKIKVLVRNSTDEHAAKSTLIENVQRVNLDPIEMGEAFKNLMDIFRMTQEEVAEKVGKKRSTVANYLRLLSLPAQIKQSVSSGKLTMGHAKAILSLDSEQLREKLTNLILEKELTVRDAEKQSRKIQREKGKKATPLANDHFEEVQENLQQRLGTKVEIDYTKKGGKVIVHFYGLEDLERIFSLISSPVDD